MTNTPTTECVYCGYDVPDEGEYVPNIGDADEWARVAAVHDPDCEWVCTQAHRAEYRAAAQSDWQ